ncbi:MULTISPECIES: FmdB family zinc ribbon protein [unclassified Nocardioides]|uniref:FmdB family zinc ribbon protein n=1 Tax=unclassified Nocardioides TaxID=2615069 RepID=UPI0006F5C326|nr:MULTISPECIES: FmdB family zinc ribbon protein [unclassified Nocardioides]KQY56797.1 FmdB family transcriptional regulator [Nocardioides sp. Root140]KQZ67007.1 FmdB family transcriptional regulator [Nocardioides sp. Root151]KRF12917.1 FmdB family transcriptional regulator [Nocardioides sp. Soil796]
MPTYQYACTECDHAFEQVQKFSDDALTVCPVCEGRLRKVFNAVGVVFKGSGFYRTDSRSGSSSSLPSSGGKESGGKDSGSKESGSSSSSSDSGSSSAKDSGSSSSSSSSSSSTTSSASSSS